MAKLAPMSKIVPRHSTKMEKQMAFSMMGGTGRMRLGSRMEPSKRSILGAYFREQRLRKKAEEERDKAAQRSIEAQRSLASHLAEETRRKARSWVNRVKSFFLRKVV